MKPSRFPHPIVLLTAGIMLAAVATYLLPAGEYDREVDEATGRSVVVAGTYHEVESAPVGAFAAVVAIPKGLIDAADVVFLILLAGGAFTVIDATGALRGGVSWMVRRLRGSDALVIPIVSVAFATGGVLENMQEEIIALIPVLLLLTRRLGYTPLVAALISAGPAFVGSAFSPINPFQVGIAQKLAELPLLSGGLFRSVFLLIALTFWIAETMRYARRTRTAPTETADRTDEPLLRRHAVILGLVVLTFAVLVYGLLALGWGFNELTALFVVMGVSGGLIGGLKINGTAEAYVEGFRQMAFAAVIVGFARAISVVLTDGHVVDTIVYGLFTPLVGLPEVASALGMVVAHTAIHIPVPSVIGQAVLTMPVLVPLADLLGLSRQVIVLAYQMGAGLCDLVTPTNGALLAILAAAGVRYDEWLRFALPRYLALLALGGVAVATAIMVGLQ